MRQYGLVGYPLSHSFSPEYFKKKFDSLGISNCQYSAYPLPDLSQFRTLVLERQLQGVNVTIPYKTAIIEYLDELDPVAREINAVNTVLNDSGKLVGYNTDVAGFSLSIQPLLQPHHKRALVLGTGGSSKAIHFALRALGIVTQSVSRTKEKSTLTYREMNEQILSDYLIVVNCSPVGMSPVISEAPDIPYHFLSAKHLVFDLIYNPPITQFLLKSQTSGAVIKNGQEMLELQADESWRIWTTHSKLH